ncbi:MAG: hypothetical protein ABIG60_05140 [Patescibacteria group bacterium]
MACFTAPAVAAIVATGLKKKISPKYHLDWLITMFWGGVAMLAIEHISSGEIVFYFPFLTAMGNPTDAAIMLKEIATVGGSMTMVIIAVWAVMVWASFQMSKKKTNTLTA